MAESSSDVVVVEEVPRWKRFQQQKHSLRIPVSEIASCVGYHPYRDLVQVALRQVYQGSAGQELLEHDAKLLGIRLEDEQELLMAIAEQAGKATQDAWKAVVQVQRGEAKVQSIEQARKLSKAVVKKAKESKKLSRTQIQQLEDASKHGVNTGFGTCWENQALDMYERQFGCEVRARNEEIRVWPFVRVEDGTTVRPLKDPYCRRDYLLAVFKPTAEPEAKRQKNNEADNTDQVPEKSGPQNTSQKYEECFFSLRGAIDGIRDELVPNAPMKDDDEDSWVLEPVIVECKHRMNRLQPSPPVYEIIQVAAYCKMYDVSEGDLLQVLRKKRKSTKEPKNDVAKETFRQQKLQFAISNNENKENDEVESNSKPPAQPVVALTAGDAKNRVRETLTPDPIPALEQKNKDSQEVSLANEDSGEVLKEKEDEHMKTVETDRESGDVPIPEENEASNEKAAEATPSIPTEANEKMKEGSRKQENDGVDEDSTAMDISVSRISMNDPRYQLNQNWESMILPRLKSWVEGIYEIRSVDDKRYRLMVASTSAMEMGEDGVLEDQSMQQLRDAWNILFQECPWLTDSDTLYNREIRFDKSR